MRRFGKAQQYGLMAGSRIPASIEERDEKDNAAKAKKKERTPAPAPACLTAKKNATNSHYPYAIQPSSALSTHPYRPY